MQSPGNCDAGKIRAFIAIPVPSGDWIEPLRQDLTDLKASDEAAKKVQLRLVPDRNLHLTLKFLGGVANHRLSELTHHLAQVCSKHPGFDYRCVGLGRFKQSLWLGVPETTHLLSLVDDIEACCRLLGFPQEAKAFTPHVTVARFAKRVSSPMTDLTAKYANTVWTEAKASEVVLFQSETLADGAEYTPLERLLLRPQ